MHKYKTTDIGKTVYWLSIDTNYFGQCIPTIIYPVPRVHKGTITQVMRNGVVKIKCFVNKDFIDTFDGLVHGVEYLPCKKGIMQEAIIGLRSYDLYNTDEEVKFSCTPSQAIKSNSMKSDLMLISRQKYDIYSRQFTIYY